MKGNTEHIPTFKAIFPDLFPSQTKRCVAFEVLCVILRRGKWRPARRLCRRRVGFIRQLEEAGRGRWDQAVWAPPWLSAFP